MRMFACIIVATALATCQPSLAAPAQPTLANPTTRQAGAKMDPSEFVHKYFDLFNQHNWEGLASMYSPTAEFKDPSLGPGIVKQSRQEFIKKYSSLSESIPDVKDTVVSVYPSGDKHVIVEFISSGTAPDGTKFELPICTIFQIDAGLITKDFTYFDNFEE